MGKQNDPEFEMAQLLRKSHCDRKSEGGAHDCVGEMTVKRGQIDLSCQLCGKGDCIPGWSTINSLRVESIFRAAGVSWGSLNIEAQVAAIRAYEKSKTND